MVKASDAVLIVQDEMEIHRHPALARMGFMVNHDDLTQAIQGNSPRLAA